MSAPVFPAANFVMNASLDSPEQAYTEAIPGLTIPGEPALEPMAPSVRSKTESPGLNRPPKPPPDLCGPYINFKTTTPDHKWLGSFLVLHRGGPQPTLSFDHKVTQDAVVLYQNIWGVTALRFDVALDIPDGTGDEKITWTLDWKEEHRSDAWHIPRWDQRWRGGFFSCNGFDEVRLASWVLRVMLSIFDQTVPESTVEDLKFDNVWKHLNSVHHQTPLHILIWGGDQIYSDFIFKDIPFLVRWLKMDWDMRWHHELSEPVSKQIAEYYFNTYLENWERPEVRKALQTSAALMAWDDHDAFDGANSYPPELHDSPVMSGLFKNASISRLLFQHHTTPARALAKDGFFGESGQNYVAQLGPRLAAFGMDSRTERDDSTVIKEETWQKIFQRLDQLPETTQHLIVISPIPFSFIRVKVAEQVFEFFKNRMPWVRKLPGISSMNSIFGLPEFYDDLLDTDEWVHESHIQERDKALVRFQQFAEKKSIRTTFLSGDVHCAGLSRFRSDKVHRVKLRPETDPRLMFVVISSAIVNQAPSANVCKAYHLIRNKWHPVAKTEEALVEMFERRPEKGDRVRFRKVMPNRNWTFWEECGSEGSMGDSVVPDQPFQEGDEAEGGHRHHHHHPHRPHFTRKAPQTADGDTALDWYRDHYGFNKKLGSPSTLSKTSDPNGHGSEGDPNHQHKHGFFCHHRRSKRLPDIVSKVRTSDEAANGLRLRMWLESRVKEESGRQFSGYSVVVPNLNTKGIASKATHGLNGAADNGNGNA